MNFDTPGKRRVGHAGSGRTRQRGLENFPPRRSSVAVLVNAAQEQQKEIEGLKAEIRRLKAKH
jgi:hypothetical protein